MSALSKIVLALAAVSLGAGCDDGGNGATPATPDAAAAGGAGGGAGGMGGGQPPHPDMGVAEQGLNRTVGRMTIEQLARSIPVVTGGLRWTEDFGQGPVDMLEVLAPTLGAPDYLLVTEENLEPSIIVAKFLQDASHRICVRWIAEDRQKPLAERTFVRHEDWESLDPADVNTTLRALKLRFFARKVEDDEQIRPLRELFQNASSTAAPGNGARDGWLAVCIALMTDPEFILY
jgi:hypothetical protein